MSKKKKSRISVKKEEKVNSDKPTKRLKEKYRALKPELNLKSRYEEIEDLASYASTLSDEDKAWLNAYAEEEICANFKHKGPKLNTTVADKRRIYNRNNARNRCVFTKQKAQGKENMDYIEVMKKLEAGDDYYAEYSDLLDYLEDSVDDSGLLDGLDSSD